MTQHPRFQEHHLEEKAGATIEEAFRQLRAELKIREGFPAEVLVEAERVATERIPAPSSDRVDRSAIGFVTIDPPGSRDLDQAVHAERTDRGYRIRYAIADVGYWVDRGSSIEKEAWKRGVTFYAPDHREPLYPPVLSSGVASLLPGQPTPAIIFEIDLDTDARVIASSIERGVIRSRAQLTYTQLLEHASPGSATASATYAETLDLLAEIGPKRLKIEVARGGVSLPIRDQHVQHSAAEELGYELVYERPSEAEGWNAQISLMAGNLAAVRMIAAGIGLLRTMPPFAPRSIEKLRRIARTLGFDWAEADSYADFIHGLDADHPHLEVLVRQARRVMRGADYVAFSGTPPDQPLHGALAFPYAHATAPLRRLGDRYVLDLLVELDVGKVPADSEIAMLRELPGVMNEADAKTSALERRVVDIAESWVLRKRVGDIVHAVVVDVRAQEVEVQVENPPIRAMLPLADGDAPLLGERVTLKVSREADEERPVLRMGHVERRRAGAGAES